MGDKMAVKTDYKQKGTLKEQVDVYNEISTNYQVKKGIGLMELACVGVGAFADVFGCQKEGWKKLAIKGLYVMANEVGKQGIVKSQADAYNEISGNFQLVDGMKLIDLAGVEAGSRVLDLGCGTGRLTAVLADRVGSKGHVVGIDPDEERLDTAREKSLRANITYIEADGETFPKGAYDLVYCNYVLHWIKDKEAVFNRVYDNLRPGGKFAFLTGLDKSPFVVEAIRTLFKSQKQKELSQNIHFIPLIELEELAAACGFTVSYKEVGTNHRPFDTVEAALDFLYASSNGSFDSSLADKDALEMFVKKYRDQKVEISTPISYVILTKPL